MKTAWFVLVISAATDFIITAATGLITAMMATGAAEIPNHATILACVLGGAVSAARTIQGALKHTPETQAALRGDFSVVKTETLTKTP